ncbi:unnamed protein product [Rangifer tarandus platyrhynchus]|uniref:Uncharacterized protein n=1 Tax=Rangifer tarandus platyrhynchus TaxID=3082113 RepID=A0AC59ZNM0_RANTA
MACRDCCRGDCTRPLPHPACSPQRLEGAPRSPSCSAVHQATGTSGRREEALNPLRSPAAASRHAVAASACGCAGSQSRVPFERKPCGLRPSGGTRSRSPEPPHEKHANPETSVCRWSPRQADRPPAD